MLERWGGHGRGVPAAYVRLGRGEVARFGGVEQPRWALTGLRRSLPEPRHHFLPGQRPELGDEDLGKDQGVGVFGACSVAVEDCDRCADGVAVTERGLDRGLDAADLDE